MTKNKKKVCVVINNRANYARIKSVLIEIKKDKRFQLQIIVGSSGLIGRFGSVVEVIKKDGFKVDFELYTLVEGENLETMAKSTGLSIVEYTSAFKKLKPNMVIVIADRYETLAAAVTASYMNIFLIHTQGGEITGSIDESVRHATTKLAHLHFPATKIAAQNVIKMGEDPKNVFNVGCPSMDLIEKKNLKINNIFKKKYSTYGVGELEINFNKPYIVVLQHPVTTEYKKVKEHIKETAKALLKLDIQVIWLWPNVDAGSNHVSKTLRRIREIIRPKNIIWQKNYTPEDYLKLIYNSQCIVGNSSSAIREGSYLGIPAVNIGERQRFRENGSNVINVIYNEHKILKAIKKQLKVSKFKRITLYGKGDAGKKIVRILLKANLNIIKKLNY
jgi:UDP-hydrolysing UDP-N-acetyl-D-glucosamine 2-epimerase